MLLPLVVACGSTGAGADGEATGGAAAAEGELGRSTPPSSTAKTSVDNGEFPMLAGPPVHSLDPFGCRHYMELTLSTTATDGAVAKFFGKLDSANPGDMEFDNCGGEQLPRVDGTKYVLHEVSKNDCNSRVLEGTVVWTDSGRVTRTLRIHDNRKATCTSGKALPRIVLEELRALDGESHLVETYNSVDPLPAPRHR